MKVRPTFWPGQKGLGLAELLVLVLVLGILHASMARAFKARHRARVAMEARAGALHQAQNLMEHLKANPGRASAGPWKNSRFSDGPECQACQVGLKQGQAGLLELSVAIALPSGARPIKLVTLMRPQ